MMPAPPKVCPLSPVPEFVPLPVPVVEEPFAFPVPEVELPLAAFWSVLPFAELWSVEDPVPVPVPALVLDPAPLLDVSEGQPAVGDEEPKLDPELPNEDPDELPNEDPDELPNEDPDELELPNEPVLGLVELGSALPQRPPPAPPPFNGTPKNP
jgi:hypothetical protein